MLQRYPVVVPAPCIEFGMSAGAQLHVAVPAGHAQEEPDLLLAAVAAATQRRLVSPQPLLGNVVSHPLAGAAEDAHMIGLQPDLFLELPVHRLHRGLALLDAALRE